MAQIKVHITLDTRGFDIGMRTLVRSAFPHFLKEAVREVGGEFVSNVYNPRMMPIDLGRARAGGRAGFIITKRPFSPVGYAKGVSEGSSMGGATLTDTKFESINTVSYAGELDTNHAGRRSGTRYNPRREVMATGPYSGFVKKGQEVTITKMGKIIPPLMNRYFNGIPYFTYARGFSI